MVSAGFLADIMTGRLEAVGVIVVNWELSGTMNKNDNVCWFIACMLADEVSRQDKDMLINMWNDENRGK